MAFDSALDRLYVAWWTALGATQLEAAPFLSVVDPVTHEVVGSISTPNCRSDSTNRLVFDPDNGLLYDLCSEDNALAIDPASGGIVANLSLGGFSEGGYCGGFVPFGLGITLAPELDELFVLVADCFSVNATSGGWNVSVSIVDDRANDVVNSVDLGQTEFSPFNLAQGESMAFDATSGQLYVDSNYLTGEHGGWEVSVIDPETGHVADTVVLTVEPSYSDVPALVYIPGSGAIYTEGLYEGPDLVSGAALYQIDLPEDRETAVVTWPGWASPPCEPGTGCGPWTRPTWLTPGPGTTSLTIAAIDLQGTTFALIYNMSDGAEEANLTTGPVDAGIYDPVDDSLFLLDSTNGRLVSVVGSPMQLGPPTALAAIAYAATVDPSTGTVFVAFGNYCGNLVQPAPGCVNDTIEAIPAGGMQPAQTWVAPPGMPAAMTFDPLNDRLYVYSECGGTGAGGVWGCFAGKPSGVTAFSLNGTVLAQSPLPGGEIGWVPAALTVDLATGELLLDVGTGHGGNALDLIDPTTTGVLSNVTVREGDGPVGLGGYDAQDNLLFAGAACVVLVNQSYRIRDCLDAFNASTHELAWNDTFSFPSLSLGQSWAFDPATDTLFLGTSTSVLSVNPQNGSVESSWNVSGGAGPLAYDPAINGLYVAGGGNLTVLNATTRAVLVADAFPPGYPEDLSVDPVTGAAVVATGITGTVVFAPGLGPASYPVEFQEVGLPSTQAWTVTVGGLTESGAGPVWFFLPNGTYSYSVTPVPGFSRSGLPESGTIVVAGEPVTEPLANFQPVVYSLAFIVSGFHPPGWSVAIHPVSGRMYAGLVNNSTEHSYLLTNGSYLYAIEGVALGYPLVGLPPVGTIVIDGASKVVHPEFGAGPTPSISFRASGRFVGTWCVLLAGVLSRCGSDSSIVFEDLSPWTYSYSITPPSGYATSSRSGDVVLGNSSASVARRFAAVDYQVTFTGRGLLAHAAWRVVVDGRTVTGRTPSLSVELPNGTYAYSAPPVRGYVGAWSGNVTVAGAGVAVDGSFVPITYAVTLVETGLPSGTTWSINVGGTVYSSTSSTITVELPNGSTAFLLLYVTGFSGAPGHGYLRVHGEPLTREFRFRAFSA